MLVGRMSIYELQSTLQAFSTMSKGIVKISDEEWEESQMLLVELAMRDPSVDLSAMLPVEGA
jgi:murein endopeptidase